MKVIHSFLHLMVTYDTLIGEQGGYMNYIKTLVVSIFSLIVVGLGGWDLFLRGLVVLMVIDYIMGLVVAGVYGKSVKSPNGGLSSVVGCNGIIKKGISLLLIIVGVELDRMLGSTFIRISITLFLSMNELISITENAGLMGLPIPPVITRAIDLLKEGSNENL